MSIQKQGNIWAANKLGRAAALVFLFVVALAFLFTLFLLSPLPIPVAEFYVKQKLPEAGYFQIKEMHLTPWKPLEVQKVEYQVTPNIKDGIWKVENIQTDIDFKTLFSKQEGTLRLSKVEFGSETAEIKGIDLELPFHLKSDPTSESREGSFKVEHVWFSNIRIWNLEGHFTQQGDVYRGRLEGQWTGGKISGEFKFEPFRKNSFSCEILFTAMDLALFSADIGGVFQGAVGKCGGNFLITGEDFQSWHVRGRMDCPKPGGRLHAQFLRDLADWVPEGVAKNVLQEEVAGKDDYYYYDEGFLTIHNETPGYWSLGLLLKNPRLRLDIPVDISNESFGVVFGNKEVQKAFKKGSESHG